MYSFSCNLYLCSSFCICAIGLFALMFSNSLIFCSNIFPDRCLFFLCVEYDMIYPLKTAFPVSQSSDGAIFGESFISRKDAHSLLT